MAKFVKYRDRGESIDDIKDKGEEKDLSFLIV